MVSDPNSNTTFWSGGEYDNGNTDVMSVSKTTNSGGSWIRFSLTTSAGYAYAIAVDPTTSNIVYAGGKGGIYMTTNGGTNWANITGGISGDIYAINIDPNTPTTLYAGTSTGVFKSTNSGGSWSNTGCSDVNAVVIDPDDPDIIYAGTGSGVYKSTQGGGNWNQMNEGLDNTDVTFLDIDPGNFLFAGTGGGSIYRWPLAGPEVAEGKYIDERLSFLVKPNPIRKRTRIHYTIATATRVELSIFDVQGRLVRNLVSENKIPGTYITNWEGLDSQDSPVPSGIYFCKIKTDRNQSTEKLILFR